MKTWIESERQGRGRRYWFRTETEADRFAAAKVAAGYHVAHEERGATVWVGFSKTMNDNIRAQQAGRDSE